MSTMVRMPVELKERLEGLKTQYGKKTIYDMIEYMIETVDRQKGRLSELHKDKEAEKLRIDLEYAYLGEEIKKQLHEFQQHVQLRQPAQAIEFLLANYDGSMDMNKLAFDTYVRLKE